MEKCIDLISPCILTNVDTKHRMAFILELEGEIGADLTARASDEYAHSNFQYIYKTFSVRWNMGKW